MFIDLAESPTSKTNPATNKNCQGELRKRGPLTSKCQRELEPKKGAIQTQNKTRSKETRTDPGCALKFIKPKYLMYKG